MYQFLTLVPSLAHLRLRLSLCSTIVKMFLHTFLSTFFTKKTVIQVDTEQYVKPMHRENIPKKLEMNLFRGHGPMSALTVNTTNLEAFRGPNSAPKRTGTISWSHFSVDSQRAGPKTRVAPDDPSHSFFAFSSFNQTGTKSDFEAYNAYTADTAPDVHQNYSGMSSQEAAIGTYGICRYFQQGFCSRGDQCHFAHILPGGPAMDRGYKSTQAQGEPCNMDYGHHSKSINAIYGNSQSQFQLNLAISLQKKKAVDDEGSRFAHISAKDLPDQILTLCKDQHGCRFLQKKIEEGSVHFLQMLFEQVYETFDELMIGINR